jgi:hypothetical protein
MHTWAISPLFMLCVRVHVRFFRTWICSFLTLPCWLLPNTFLPLDWP